MGINLFEITGTNPNDPAAIAAGEDFDDFANLITALVHTRKQRGLRQKDVARLMDTKQSVVSDLERVGGNPTIRTLQKYARAVGCRVRLRATVVETNGWTNAGNFGAEVVSATSATGALGRPSEYKVVA